MSEAHPGVLHVRMILRGAVPTAGLHNKVVKPNFARFKNQLLALACAVIATIVSTQLIRDHLVRQQ